MWERYNEKSSLRKHIKRKHEGARYPCDNCEFAATTSGSLKSHIKSKHRGLRYPCDYAAMDVLKR